MQLHIYTFKRTLITLHHSPSLLFTFVFCIHHGSCDSTLPFYVEKVNKAIIKPEVKNKTTKTPAETKKETGGDGLAKVIIEIYLSHEYLSKTEHCKTAWELLELLSENFESKIRI